MSDIQGYPVEEVLELAGELAVKYTSGESSSISWERAAILTEAVLYCLEEYREEKYCLENTGTPEAIGRRKEAAMDSVSGPAVASAHRDAASAGTEAHRDAASLREAYRAGYDIVLRKTETARMLYHEITEEFEDYHCRNYRDTILRGIPGFFTHYDARLDPADSILTFDYPSMIAFGERKGVGFLYSRLRRKRLEKAGERNPLSGLCGCCQSSLLTVYSAAAGR